MARKRGEGRLVGLLALTAVAVFLAGELVLVARSERGGFFLARHGLPFPRSQVMQSLSRSLRATLQRLGVPPGAQKAETAPAEGGAIVRWQVRLPPRASLFLVNAALSETFEARGGRVFDAWEEPAGSPGERVTLRLGIGRSVTHEVVLARRAEGEGEEIVRLALVLEGFAREGADSLADAALELPFEFTGAVLTNGRRARRWAEILSRRRHEVIAHVPMEPLNYPARSPGPDAILVDMTRGQIKRLVRRHLRAAPSAVALLPYMGGMALQDPSAMRAVADELRGARLAYLEVAGETHSVGLETASSAGVPFLRLDARLNLGRGPSAWRARTAREQLAELADTARRRGFASCVARLDAGVLRVLEREIPRLEKQGVRLVPVSALLRPSVL